jgi:hypothetical protein
MNAIAEAPWHLVIDLRAESGQTTKRRLDVSARTAEPVVEIEMSKGGVEIVPPHQAHDATAEPDAFRVPGGAIDGLGGFHEFVGLALAVLAGIGRIGGGRLARLVLGGRGAALGKRASDTDQQCKPGDGEVTQNRILKLKRTSTHKIPDLLPAPCPARTHWFVAVQIGPQCGRDGRRFPMTDISDFVQQSHDFVALW